MPGQTKGRRKAFLEWADIDLSSKLSLACRGNVNYYKSVLHPILTLREHPGNYFQNKLVSCLKLWVSRYILFLSKLKRRVRPFLEGARRGVALWDYPQEHLVVNIDKKSLSFCEIWNNPTPPLLLIKTLYIQGCYIRRTYFS